MKRKKEEGRKEESTLKINHRLLSF
jgi:hypothetical protein